MPDLEALIARLAGDEALLRRSDEATRQGAVLPVLESLGWDHRNLSEVVPQVPVRGGRVSYGLGAGGRALAFVEARRAGDDPAERQRWFVEAAAGEGVPLAALTDGLAWQIYLSAEAAGVEQRLVCAADFRSDPPARAAADLRRLLDRDAVVSGAALEAAQREFVARARLRSALPTAWEQLLSDPDSLLGDLLAEQVVGIAGQHPDPETVSRFLREALGRYETAATAHPGPPPTAVAVGERDFVNTRPAAFWIDNTRYAATTWREVLTGTCNALLLVMGPAFADAVVPLRGSKWTYFSRAPRPLREPLALASGGLFVEGKLGANGCTQLALRVLTAVRGPGSTLRIELAE